MTPDPREGARRKYAQIMHGTKKKQTRVSIAQRNMPRLPSTDLVCVELWYTGRGRPLPVCKRCCGGYLASYYRVLPTVCY